MSLSDRPTPRTARILLGVLCIAALGLRFWRLGDWNFQSTEIFTLRDSVTPQFSNPRPLGYLLTYFLVRPFHPLDEFGLRLLPAIFGVLTIPAFYYASRRMVGARAALIGTLFVTASPLLISYAQLARYWSLVFLLSAIYPYALYVGVRERNRTALTLGIVTGLLAALAHPVAVLLLGGPALLLLAQLRHGAITRLWRQPRVRWSAFAILLVAVGVVIWFFPVLQEWVTAHDENPGSGQFLLHAQLAAGVKQIVYLMAYTESLTYPVALAAALGLWVLWQRDRALAAYLASLAIFPILFLALISLRTPVSTYYLLPTAPVFYMAAGVFVDRLLDIEWSVRPRWLPAAAIVLLALAAGAPTLISDYRNGRRYDFRAGAGFLHEQMTAADVVYSDQPMVLKHYLKGVDVQRLRPDTAPLKESLESISQAGQGTLWIVAPAPSHALRTSLKEGGLINWMFVNCQLKGMFGKGRMDFRQQYLQVYRCPPAAAEASR